MKKANPSSSMMERQVICDLKTPWERIPVRLITNAGVSWSLQTCVTTTMVELNLVRWSRSRSPCGKLRRWPGQRLKTWRYSCVRHNFMQLFASQNPYTPDEQLDLSPFKRFIALNESSTLTSPGWDRLCLGNDVRRRFLEWLCQNCGATQQRSHAAAPSRHPPCKKQETTWSHTLHWKYLSLLVCICPGLLLLLPCGTQPCLSLHHRQEVMCGAILAGQFIFFLTHFVRLKWENLKQTFVFDWAKECSAQSWLAMHISYSLCSCDFLEWKGI